MKLRIVGGTLDVEIEEGSMSVNDVKSMLKKLSIAQEEEAVASVKNAGNTSVEVNSSKSKMIGKLGAKAKMPI